MVSNTERREQTKPYATFSDSSGTTVTCFKEVMDDEIAKLSTVQRPKNIEYFTKWALDGLDIGGFRDDVRRNVLAE